MLIPRALAASLAPLAKQVLGKDWSIYGALLDHWSDIVGPTYAELTTPVKITFPHRPLEPRREGGTLTVRLPKGLALEFTYELEKVRSRVNTYFGYEAIGKIVFETVAQLPPEKHKEVVPDPILTQKFEAEIAILDNEELREALNSLGKSILSDNLKVKKPT